jgi:hypothetical protein
MLMMQQPLHECLVIAIQQERSSRHCCYAARVLLARPSIC